MAFGFRKRTAAEPTAQSVTEPTTTTESAETENKAVENSEVARTTSISEGVIEHSVDQLHKFKKLHQWDLNLPIEKLDVVDHALDVGDLEKKVDIEHNLLEENSPYPDVAAAVRNYDE